VQNPFPRQPTRHAHTRLGELVDELVVPTADPGEGDLAAAAPQLVGHVGECVHALLRNSASAHDDAETVGVSRWQRARLLDRSDVRHVVDLQAPREGARKLRFMRRTRRDGCRPSGQQLLRGPEQRPSDGTHVFAQERKAVRRVDDGMRDHRDSRHTACYRGVSVHDVGAQPPTGSAQRSSERPQSAVTLPARGELRRAFPVLAVARSVDREQQVVLVLRECPGVVEDCGLHSPAEVVDDVEDPGGLAPPHGRLAVWSVHFKVLRMWAPVGMPSACVFAANRTISHISPPEGRDFGFRCFRDAIDRRGRAQRRSTGGRGAQRRRGTRPTPRSSGDFPNGGAVSGRCAPRRGFARRAT
jgi:hypothetical protein